jgi:hypothetical protein
MDSRKDNRDQDRNKDKQRQGFDPRSSDKDKQRGSQGVQGQQGKQGNLQRDQGKTGLRQDQGGGMGGGTPGRDINR